MSVFASSPPVAVDREEEEKCNEKEKNSSGELYTPKRRLLKSVKDLKNVNKEQASPCFHTPFNGISVSQTETKNVTPTTASNEAKQKEENHINSESGKSTAMQTGLDRYITITKKRKISPYKGKSAKITKINESEHPTTSRQDRANLIATENVQTSNRFSILDDENSDNQNNLGQPQPSTLSRPPPIFLREAISSSLVSSLSNLVGNNNFHVVSHTAGKIKETKIQIYTEKNYRIVTSYLDKEKKNYYTYQLKSSKGLSVVIKGIESSVDPNEIKHALSEKGFEAKLVTNILNKNRVAQPMFKIELIPTASKLKKNQTHPIYSIQYLLHRRVRVEEPHKRTGPIQCTNCQEFGHTKSYCTLRTVCVACGDFHQVAQCNLDKSHKEDQEKIKCGNCLANHTANYRGCPVYIALKKRLTQRKQNIRNPSSYSVQHYPNEHTAYNPITPGISYANALRSEPNQTVNNHTIPQNNVGLDSTMNSFFQTMNVFMTTLQATLQDLSKTQNQMLQILMAQK